MKLIYLLCFLPLLACQLNPAKPGINSARSPIMIDSSSMNFPWLAHSNYKNNIQNSLALPIDYVREHAAQNSFAYWLRHLIIKPDDHIVNLYDGQEKDYQEAQYAILDIDVGHEDLQQCADAVMRLRAEYLFSQQLFDRIHFRYTSGDNAAWNDWRAGLRPSINGNLVTWKQSAKADNSYANFKNYLQNIFRFCGSLSLSRELIPVANIHDIQAGDVFIKGGTPGHTVIVVDVAMNPKTGKKIFMIAQSFMPAQEIHILKNPKDENLSPWYAEDFGESLITPQYQFELGSLMRFKSE